MEDEAAAAASPPSPFTPSPGLLAPALLRALESPSLSPKAAVSLLLFTLPLSGGGGGGGNLPFHHHLRAAVRDVLARKLLGAAAEGGEGMAQVGVGVWVWVG